MTEFLVGTKKGLFRLEGDGDGFEITARAFAGQSVEYAMRDPRRAGTSRPSRPGSTARRLDHRRSHRRVGAGRRARSPRVTRGRRAHLGDRAWRGRRTALRGRRPRPAVREPRRRRDLGAQPQASGSIPRAADWSPGGGGLVPPHHRALARRPEAAGVGDLGSGVWLSDDGGKTLAARDERDRRRATSRRSRATDTIQLLRPQRPARRLPTPSGCSCSSTAASIARTMRARPGSTSATGCRPTSASRSSMDPADPDSAYVIPLIGAEDRMPPGGAMRV